MSDFTAAAEELVERADAAAEKEGIDRLKAENALVGDACERVDELSRQNAISKSELSALADTLGDTLARYNKTDLKDELQTHFSNGSEGRAFNEIIESRLDTLQTIHSTDSKQGVVWRWEFSDGVTLETETSKDGGRKHYDWQAFKRDYFDALVGLGNGETIGEPDGELKDSEEWQSWIDDTILEHAEPVKHVGPRTEAVRLLRDYISRNVAYTDLEYMRERNGVWADAGDAEAVTTIRVPLDEIKRICDSLSISTRALQIELDARGLTDDDTNGVSGAGYVDGARVPYWVLDATIADPADVISDPSTPAEKAEARAEKRAERDRTAVGATDDSDATESATDDESAQPASDGGTDTEPMSDEDTTDDYEPGMTDSFGEDPDQEASDD